MPAPTGLNCEAHMRISGEIVILALEQFLKLPEGCRIEGLHELPLDILLTLVGPEFPASEVVAHYRKLEGGEAEFDKFVAAA